MDGGTLRCTTNSKTASVRLDLFNTESVFMCFMLIYKFLTAVQCQLAYLTNYNLLDFTLHMNTFRSYTHDSESLIWHADSGSCPLDAISSRGKCQYLLLLRGTVQNT